jgi:hypothetical protein
MVSWSMLFQASPSRMDPSGGESRMSRVAVITGGTRGIGAAISNLNGSRTGLALALDKTVLPSRSSGVPFRYLRGMAACDGQA